MNKIDKSGRIAIPIEYRRRLGWQEKDDIDMIATNNSVILRKAIDGCMFCGLSINLVRMGNYCICRNCINKLHEAKNGDILYQ